MVAPRVLNATDQRRMHTASLEVKEQFSGVYSLWIVVNHHQVWRLVVSACADNPLHTGEVFFYVVYLVIRQGFIDMNHSISIKTDHLLHPPCHCVKFEVRTDGWEYNVLMSH